MKQNPLGKTHFKVPELAFGCWAIAGGMNWGDQDEATSIDTLRTALDNGLTFLDTAPAYGHGYSEELVGRATEGRRDECFIATKASGQSHDPETLRKACEDSLKRLRTDHIDFYQIHWPRPTVPIPETVEGLEALYQAGKVRAYGVCNFGPEQLQEYIGAGGQATTNQVGYNLIFRAIEFEVVPATHHHGMGILAYSPIMQGMISDRYLKLEDVPADRRRTRHFSTEQADARHGEDGFEDLVQETLDRIRAIAGDMGRPTAEVAMRWLLDRGGVTSVLIGGRTPEQVMRNLKAAEDPLPGDVLNALSEATDALKQAMGPNPDMWQAKGRIR
jgi:aryl-alcohol dehydrogenase-like predicted oxidoreductase